MLHIRPATPADVPTLLRFIRELAAYEREPDKVVATEADLLRDGFGLDPQGKPLHPAPPPRFHALIADWTSEPHQAAEPYQAVEPVGFALYFRSYSTWVGHHGIRLEDLYVTPARRGQGIGRALLATLARIALEEGCTRLEWDVLTWNEPALAVYRRLGATVQEDWRILRLSGEALRDLAQE